MSYESTQRTGVLGRVFAWGIEGKRLVGCGDQKDRTQNVGRLTNVVRPEYPDRAPFTKAPVNDQPLARFFVTNLAWIGLASGLVAL